MMGPPATFALMFLALALPALLLWGARHGWRERQLGLLSPVALVAAFHTVHFVLPGLNIWLGQDFLANYAGQYRDVESFNTALLLANLSLLAFGFGYGAHAGVPRVSPVPAGMPDLHPALLYGMLLAGFALKIVVILQFGNLEQVLQRLSPTLRASFREGGLIEESAILLALSGIADAVVVFLLFRSISSRRGYFIALAVMFVILPLNYMILAKRTVVLALLLYGVGAWHFLRRPIRLKQGIAIGIVCAAIIVATILARIIVPQLSVGYDYDFLKRNVFPEGIIRFYLNSPELAMIDMVILAIQERATVLAEFGGRIMGVLYFNFAPFAFTVPRALWAGKPEFVDTSHIMYRMSAGQSSHVSYSLGFVGYWYVIGGAQAVLLASAALGWLSRRMVNLVNPLSRDPVRVFVYVTCLWMLFHFLRFGTLGFTYLLFLQSSIMPCLLFAFAALWRRRLPGRPLSAARWSASAPAARR